MGKTEGVCQLVRDVLETFSEPYGEDIIEDVCLAIQENPQLKQRYDELSAELGAGVVNQRIGRYTKEITGLQTLRKVRKVKVERCHLIKSYTKLTPRSKSASR